MRKFGVDVEEYYLDNRLSERAYFCWVTDESTVYYCKDNGIYYIKMEGVRTPVKLSNESDVYEYFDKIAENMEIENQEDELRDRGEKTVYALKVDVNKAGRTVEDLKGIKLVDVLTDRTLSAEERRVIRESRCKTFGDFFDYYIKSDRHVFKTITFKRIVNLLYVIGVWESTMLKMGIDTHLEKGYRLRKNDEWLYVLEFDSRRSFRTFKSEKEVIPETYSKCKAMKSEFVKKGYKAEDIEIDICGDFLEVELVEDEKKQCEKIDYSKMLRPEVFVEEPEEVKEELRRKIGKALPFVREMFREYISYMYGMADGVVHSLEDTKYKYDIIEKDVLRAKSELVMYLELLDENPNYKKEKKTIKEYLETEYVSDKIENKQYALFGFLKYHVKDFDYLDKIKIGDIIDRMVEDEGISVRMHSWIKRREDMELGEFLRNEYMCGGRRVTDKEPRESWQNVIKALLISNGVSEDMVRRLSGEGYGKIDE